MKNYSNRLIAITLALSTGIGDYSFASSDLLSSEACIQDDILLALKESDTHPPKFCLNTSDMKYMKSSEFHDIVDDTLGARDVKSIVGGIAELRKFAVCGYSQAAIPEEDGVITDLIQKKAGQFNNNTCLQYWQTQLECILVLSGEPLNTEINLTSSVSDPQNFCETLQPQQADSPPAVPNQPNEIIQ